MQSLKNKSKSQYDKKKLTANKILKSQKLNKIVTQKKSTVL